MRPDKTSKRIITAAIFLLTQFISIQSIAAMNIESRIDRVTVFPEGALVTRIATIELSKGKTDVSLTGLMGSLKLDSIQLEVADTGVQIGQLALDKEQQRDAYNQSITDIREKINAEEAAKQELQDKINAAELRLKFIESVSQGYAKEAWTAGARGNANISSWSDALKLIQSESDDANALIRNHRQTIRDKDKTLSQLKRELQQLRGASLASSELSVTLDAGSATQTKILLHYFQERANWYPVYEARLDSDTGTLAIAQQAIVSQSSDEDWQNVQLTLSTSQPGDELEMPELYSEVIDLYRPINKPKRHAHFTADMPAPVEYALEEVVVNAQKRVNTADIGNFAVSYPIAGRANVPNKKSSDLTFDLSRHRTDARLVTTVMPRESTDAFLVAKFKHEQTLPMYSGDMRVFVDGVYVGISEMPNVLPQAEVSLPMGQDRRVDVIAQTQIGEHGNSGIISKRNVESVDYLFKINNRRNTSTQVEVYDRYPVARNKAIKVSIPKTATAPTEKDVDELPGIIVWRKQLEAGERFEIRHQYSVSYPANEELITDYE